MARTRQTARKSTGGKAPRKFRLSAKEKKSNSSESVKLNLSFLKSHE